MIINTSYNESLIDFVKRIEYEATRKVRCVATTYWPNSYKYKSATAAKQVKAYLRLLLHSACS